MAFEISTVLTGSVAEFTLSGALDKNAQDRFQHELDAAAVVKPTRLVLHMRDLDYLSSAGVRILLFAKQQLGRGLAIYMIAPQEQALDTLRRTGLFDNVIILDEYLATTR
jgi:anti-anti-sigma factor